jgi:transcriptional regulator with XRE-family HTH domain
MNAEWFAGRLRELREQAGLSREELAEQAGMKVGGIRDLEQGVNQPRWETVLVLAKVFGVTCEAFNQQPTERPAVKPGRPRKANTSDQAAPEPQPSGEQIAAKKAAKRKRAK